MKKDVFLAPIGSAGDVHPFLGLGRELAGRGHRVTVITNPYFEAAVRRLGLEFEPLGTREEFVGVLDHPDLWHPTKAVFFVMTRGALPPMRPLYEILARKADPRKSVVAASVLALGARIAQEKLGLPLVSVHLQPAVFRSADEPPAPVPKWLPAPLVRTGYRLFDWKLDSLVGPALNGFRRELGLPPVQRVMKSWWHSPDRIVCLFPEWFAPKAPDWPAQASHAGFPLFDDDDGSHWDPSLEGFLMEEPPIVFMAGSANAQAAGFFAQSLDACRRLGRPGVFLTQFPGQLPRPLPPSVRHASYVPLGRLLPMASAVVHHGGIGTTAQSLAAGIPQLIRPLAHDQFDNAERVRALGAGLVLSEKKYDGPRAAETLGRLLAGKAFLDAAREVSERLSGAKAIQSACDLILDAGAPAGA